MISNVNPIQVKVLNAKIAKQIRVEPYTTTAYKDLTKAIEKGDAVVRGFVYGNQIDNAKDVIFYLIEGPQIGKLTWYIDLDKNLKDKYKEVQQLFVG